MTRPEFFALTLRQWAALRDRREDSWKRSERMTELMGGQIVAMVRRCGFVRWKEPASAEDYMPSVQLEKARREAALTAEERLARSWEAYSRNRAAYLGRKGRER
jgi:hypothetical protein